MTALHKPIRCNAGLACTWNLLVTNPWLSSYYCSWKRAVSCGFTSDKFHAEIAHAYTYMLLLQETGTPLKARRLLYYRVLLVCETMKGRNFVPVVTREHTIGKRIAWVKCRKCIQLFMQNTRKHFLLTFINALRSNKRNKINTNGHLQAYIIAKNRRSGKEAVSFLVANQNKQMAYQLIR